MSELVNLIPDPSTAGAYVPRPAAVMAYDFSDFDTPGVISSLIVIGDRAYGTIQTQREPGFDEPFIYDLEAGTIVAFDGVTADNVPLTQALTGEWTPPIGAQVGSRVLLTHPGFSGWIVLETVGTTHGNTTLDSLTSTTGVAVGQEAAGEGILAGTRVVEIVSATEVTLSRAATTSASNIPITFSSAGLVSWLQQIQGDTVSGTPFISGNPLASPYPPFEVFDNVAVGQRVYGLGIPLDTTITAIAKDWFSTTCTGTAGSPDITVADPTGIANGQLCLLPADVMAIQSFVINVVGSVVTLNVNLDGNAAADLAQFFSSLITLSDDATATNSGVDFTVLGGGEATQFGWWDQSGFELEIIGAVASLPLVTGNFSVLGIQPGMTLTGPGILTGTTVLATAEIVCRFSVDTTAGSSALTDASPSSTGAGGIWPGIGFTISGSGIPVGATITAWDSTARTIVISEAATLTGNNVTVTMAGAMIVTAETISTTGDFLTYAIAGGTFDAPLWGAGDTDRNPLPSKPVGVAQFNARAYFACERDGVPFSDAGFACRRTISTYALLPNNGLPVSAIAPLMMKAPLTGGIVQALLAFQRTVCIQQITGDPVTLNLQMNLLPVATGTDAPLSITPCELGTAFLSPLGLRLVGFDGTVTAPLGAMGQGVTQPFQYATVPSRMCVAATTGVLRLSTQNGLLVPAPQQEYFFHLAGQSWSGPHSFPARLVQPWRSTFVVVPWARTRSLWQSDIYPSLTSVYEEDGAQLTWIYDTVLLPDTGAIAMNSMVEANLALAASSAFSFTVSALDENLVLLDAIEVATTGGGERLRERPLYWTVPVIFKQMQIRVTGVSDYTVHLGNIYLRYQILGYNAGIDDEGNFLLSDADIILDNNSDDHLTPG